jgi:transposase
LFIIIDLYFSVEERYSVLVITKDGAENYDYLARQAFPRAIRVIDKYHVVKEVFDTLDSLRNYLKNKHIIEMEKEQEESLRKYQIAVKNAKKKGIAPPSKKLYEVEERILENGDTIKQLLARSKHLLYKYKDNWNSEQEKRAEILFREFPDIEKIYTQVIKFRTWYSATNLYEQPIKTGRNTCNVKIFVYIQNNKVIFAT